VVVFATPPFWLATTKVFIIVSRGTLLVPG
jgi:hypothetical protein